MIWSRLEAIPHFASEFYCVVIHFYLSYRDLSFVFLRHILCLLSKVLGVRINLMFFFRKIKIYLQRECYISNYQNNLLLKKQ